MTPRSAAAQSTEDGNREVARSRNGRVSHSISYQCAATPTGSRSCSSLDDRPAATLSMVSTDFPNQDVLPVGGFGNLIALPLQLAARKVGNTEFLDDNLQPHADQWSYLASVQRISGDLLQELVRQSEQEGELAIRSADDESQAPWRPLRPLRERLRAVLCAVARAHDFTAMRAPGGRIQIVHPVA